jgi:hypothetical protein
MTVDFCFADNLSYLLLDQFIAYPMLRFGNPEDRQIQDMFFRVFTGYALKANPDAPPTEILESVLESMSRVSDIPQT